MTKAPYVEAEAAGNGRDHRSYRPRRIPDADAIKRTVELMARAKRPLFYAGGGVINAGPGAAQSLAALVRRTGYPITNTLMGLGCYPGTDPLFLGMLGMHGTYEANMAMAECDLMIAVGARFDDRVTGRLADFSTRLDQGPDRHRSVLHQQECAGRRRHHRRCGPRARRHHGRVEASGAEPNAEAQAAWWRQLEAWRGRDCLRYKNSGTAIKPQYALQRLYEATKGRDVYFTTEVGQHQMWAAQFLKIEEPNRWMTSGGLGTMGYGFPAAMGVQVAHPDSLVIDVAGEASLLMVIQELSTMVQHRLPVKTFLLNNEYMGMVRQWQEFFHGGRYAESYMDSLPDFVKLAESFGATGLQAKRPEDVDDVIQAMIETPGPVIADIQVDKEENVYPMIPAGAAHYEMKLGPEHGELEERSEDGMVLV